MEKASGKGFHFPSRIERNALDFLYLPSFFIVPLIEKTTWTFYAHDNTSSMSRLCVASATLWRIKPVLQFVEIPHCCADFQRSHQSFSYCVIPNSGGSKHGVRRENEFFMHNLLQRSSSNYILIFIPSVSSSGFHIPSKF